MSIHCLYQIWVFMIKTQQGMVYWCLILGILSWCVIFKQSHLYENMVPIYLICRCLNFKCAAKTWLHDRILAVQSQQWPSNDVVHSYGGYSLISVFQYITVLFTDTAELIFFCEYRSENSKYHWPDKNSESFQNSFICFLHIDGLIQEGSNSIFNAPELPQAC